MFLKSLFFIEKVLAEIKICFIFALAIRNKYSDVLKKKEKYETRK